MDHKVKLGERAAAELRALAADRAEGPLRDLVTTLVATPELYRRKNAVLTEFRKTLKGCRAWDQAEKEALVTDLEAVLEILHIDSSDGLLNEWLHGISL